MGDEEGAPVAVSDEVPPFTVRHYQQFLDLLLAPDQTLTSILCDTVDSSDADRFVKHLYTVYQAHGKVSTLLTSTITREIQNCSKSALLFRTNSPCTKIMTVFARNQGLGYLKQTIQASVRVVAEGSEIFEVDPMRAKPGMDLEANMVTLSRHVESFLESIFASYHHFPRMMREVCNTLQTVTKGKFDDATHTTVAGFYFLRYVCPAIVAPPSYSLLETFPKKESHRGLVLIAKTLQNLANGVKFGVKEAHMDPLNATLGKYDTQVKEFLDQLASVRTGGPEIEPEVISEQVKLASLYEIYQSLSKNSSRISDHIAAVSSTLPTAPGVWASTKAIIAELERVQRSFKSDPSAASKTKLPELLFGEAKSTVLNMEMEWRDVVRPPIVVVTDLLMRLRRIAEDHLQTPSSVGGLSSMGGSSMAVVGPRSSIPAAPTGGVVEWGLMADSVDMKEFVLDAAELQKVDLSLLTTQKEEVAFWLNVHNLLALHIHCESGGVETKSRRRAFFHSYVYEVGFQQFSLEDLVQGVLRGNPNNHFKKRDPRAAICMKQYDPRSHFGYSFLTVSSPPIRIFKPDTLSVQLTLAAEQFLQEQVSVNEEKRRIRLPYLLKQYYQDFGIHETDLFRWLAKYLDQQLSQEISILLATTHYAMEYQDQSWEQRRRLFVDDPPHLARVSPTEQFNADFPLEATMQRARESSTANSIDSLDDMGVLNLDVKWTGRVFAPQDVVIRLLSFAQGLCQIFLFDWGSVAGSPEFKAFLLATSELQGVKLDTMQRNELLVFWTNVYNLLMIHLYIMKRPPAEMAFGLGRKHFFNTYKYHIGGFEFSLEEIEHGVIRGNALKKVMSKKDPRFKGGLTDDPRISFALSMLTKSSPVIRAYTVDKWEEQLTRSTQTFLRTHVTIATDKGKVTLPDLCKSIYENNFNKNKEAMLKWVSPFLAADQRHSLDNLLAQKVKVSLSFDDMSWTPWPVFEK